MEDIRGPENSEKQEQLIRRYCPEFETQLSQAPDRASALQMKESLCARFETECESALVISAIRQHLEILLKRRWGNL
jgi:hypothetical protein